ncbi:MAG: flagellar basal body-associated FliL family protein [Chromatiaceae bacterium]|jgi:flagellar FliL protein|nr:flagellar basal body-associated FliL family protein [Chromatiaceae bacterium]
MADEKDIAGDEPPRGGKKKLILIIAVAALLLLGAGAAALFLVGGAQQQTADGEDSPQQEAVAVEEGEPVYHKLDPAFVVNLPPGGPAGMLQIAIEVMTRTPSVLATLDANAPMLRHHLLNLLEEQQSAGLMTVQGKEALQKAIFELLSSKLRELNEPGEIKGVFFTQFVMQ